MNPNTGELLALQGGKEMPDGFERLYGRQVELLASLKLGRTDGCRAQVNLRSQSPLALWAKKKRKAKIAAASRRRNRK